jgi:hypothetical protein
MLKCDAHIFETKRHDTICEGTPQDCESYLVLILGAHADLIVTGEDAHEGYDSMTNTCIDDLIDKGCGVILFGTSPIQIKEVCAYMDDPLFLSD